MSVASAGAALETSGLCKSFGALAVAQDIDFRLERGVRHALIGPNGEWTICRAAYQHRNSTARQYQ